MNVGDVIGVGRFKLLERLDRNHHGRVTVWRAQEHFRAQVGAVVVIKAFDLSGRAGRIATEFSRELAGLSELQHPNIVAYRTAFEEGSTACVVMEWASGGTLEEVARKWSPTERITKTIRYLLGPAEALDYVRRQEQVHRDVKPANILLVGEVAKLADFELARDVLRPAETHTARATFEYLAPEHWPGSPYQSPGGLEAPRDVYAFGVTLFELAAGRRPFDAAPDDHQAWGRQHLEAEVAVPAAWPEPLRRLVAGCLVKDPARRLEMGEAVELLRGLQPASPAEAQLRGALSVAEAALERVSHGADELRTELRLAERARDAAEAQMRSAQDSNRHLQAALTAAQAESATANQRMQVLHDRVESAERRRQAAEVDAGVVAAARAAGEIALRRVAELEARASQAQARAEAAERARADAAAARSQAEARVEVLQQTFFDRVQVAESKLATAQAAQASAEAALETQVAQAHAAQVALGAANDAAADAQARLTAAQGAAREAELEAQDRAQELREAQQARDAERARAEVLAATLQALEADARRAQQQSDLQMSQAKAALEAAAVKVRELEAELRVSREQPDREEGPTREAKGWLGRPRGWALVMVMCLAGLGAGLWGGARFAERQPPDMSPLERLTAVGFEWVPSRSASAKAGRPVQFSRSEVTVSQYAQCVAAKGDGCSSPATGNYCNWDKRSERGEHPINCVTWHQAAAFCTWVGGRLPTDEEWSAEAGAKGEYPWGDTPPPDCTRAVMDDGKTKGSAGTETDGCGEDRTDEVCQRPSGNSDAQLCDMSGNVWEWVDGSGGLRGLRGGSWSNGSEGPLRASARYEYAPSNHYHDLGFRCVFSPGPEVSGWFLNLWMLADDSDLPL